MLGVDNLKVDFLYKMRVTDMFVFRKCSYDELQRIRLREDLLLSGWILAYYQWYTAKPFSMIWKSMSIRMLQKMYPTFHEADIEKTVATLSEMIKPVKKSSISDLRLVRGMTQQQLAKRAHMSISQLQR